MENLAFTITFPKGNGIIKIPKEMKVGDLVSKAEILFHNLFPESSFKFLTLISHNKNEVLDSFLSDPSRSVSFLANHLSLKAYCSENNESNEKDGEKIDLKNFEFIKCIGKGGTSIVYLVRNKKTGKIYALKQLHKSLLNEPRRLEQILLEKAIMKDLDYQFIAKLHASFETKDHLNFLMEFYPGGELFFHLQKRRLTEEAAKFYFCEILLTLEFLHKKKILYRDLKPENLLLDIDGHIRLTDFGLSKVGMFGAKLTHSFCGSPEYMAPEIVSGLGYSYSVDFYTIGALLHEFTTGLPPFYDSDPEKILKNVLKDDLKFSSKLSPMIVNLLSGLLEKNPKRRINTFDKIKRSDWICDVKWEEFTHKLNPAPIIISLENSNIHPDFRDIELPQNKVEKFSFKVENFYFVQPSSISEFEKNKNQIRAHTEESKFEERGKKKSFDQKIFDDLLLKYKNIPTDSTKVSEKITLSKNKTIDLVSKDNINFQKESFLVETRVESRGMNMDKIKRAFSPKAPDTKFQRTYESFKNLKSDKPKEIENQKNIANYSSHQTLRSNQNTYKPETFISNRTIDLKAAANAIPPSKKTFFETKIRNSIEQLKSIQNTNERYKKNIQIETHYEHILNKLASPSKQEYNQDYSRRSHQHLQSASFLETKDPSKFFNSKKENYTIDRIIPSSAKAANNNYQRPEYSSITGSFIGATHDRDNSSRRFFEMNNVTASKQHMDQYRSGIFTNLKENNANVKEANHGTKYTFTSDMKQKPVRDQTNNYNCRNNSSNLKNMHPVSAKNLQYSRRMFM